MTTPRTAAADLFTGKGAGWRIAGAAMLVSTLAVQHPNPMFNRLQLKDTFSMLPNWRFFAPTPATHDYHFVYRTLGAEGTTSPWQGLDVIEGRKPWQIAWFPTRRPEKAVFDICSEILHVIDKGFAVVTRTAGYRTLTEHLRATLLDRGTSAREIKGFQFALARATGYDTTHTPEMVFVSPYIPFAPGAAVSPPAVRAGTTVEA
ncbi:MULTISPECIES: hypothetical protein [Streptomyces]|uniref:Uncharacterized protein n=2 Tax=Streptomyces TaxID=1883 RepID=A0A2N8P8I4_STRNR|nr:MULTISPECIES: hypothetical protein [Streptomyces]PNE37327.1 hypothetical protein AOB60_23625 [Streptomyces noursei]SHM24381.1 hypothetical protein SAMN05216268_109230 [Streptomyces yunnanensis]